MNAIYHIDFNNDCEFKYHCTKESIKAFDKTIDSKTYPTRPGIFLILLSDLITSPFYLAKKIVDLAVYIFHLMNIKNEDLRKIDWSTSDLCGIIIFQLFNPIACTAVRISSAVIGLVIPSIALKGWKIAEHGESLSLLLWIDIFKDIDYQSFGRQAYEEISPTHAIYYLGEKQTHISLDNDSMDYEEIEDNIFVIFEMLLRAIADDRDCFQILFNYHRAIDSHVKISKNGKYQISHDVKQILKQLKSYSQDDILNIDDFIDLLKTEISIEEFHRLFNHININLRNSFLEDTLNLDKMAIEGFLTDLKDLFSRRFKFGRACFPRSFYNPYCSASN